MEKNFVRVRSVKDIIISATLIFSGILLLLLPDSTGIHISGFFIMMIGMLLAFTLKSCYKDEETGFKYCNKERYFEGSRREELSSAISASLRVERADTKFSYCIEILSITLSNRLV